MDRNQSSLKKSAVKYGMAIRAAIVGSISLILPHLNGAVVGILAISGAYIAETMVLGWQIRNQTKGTDSLFVHYMVF